MIASDGIAKYNFEKMFAKGIKEAKKDQAIVDKVNQAKQDYLIYGKK